MFKTMLTAKKSSLYACVFGVILLADRVTKEWAVRVLSSISGEPALGAPVLFFNRGISFSMLQDSPTGIVLTVGLFSLGLGVFICSRNEVSQPLGAIFLLAGVLGNLADRLMWGYVVDWFYIGVYINLADLYICLGAFLFLSHILFRQQENREHTP